jgi:hypothetical protein
MVAEDLISYGVWDSSQSILTARSTRNAWFPQTLLFAYDLQLLLLFALSRCSSENITAHQPLVVRKMHGVTHHSCQLMLWEQVGCVISLRCHVGATLQTAIHDKSPSSLRYRCGMKATLEWHDPVLLDEAQLMRDSSVHGAQCYDCDCAADHTCCAE